MMSRRAGRGRRPVQDPLFADVERAALETVVARDAPSWRVDLPMSLPMPVTVDAGQLDLFTPSTLLRGDVELAITRAEFAAAVAAREALITEFPRSVQPGELDYLDILAASSWDPPRLADHVAAWSVASQVIADRARRARVGGALYRRLLSRFAPREIAEADAESLVRVVAVLWQAGHDGACRLLVRDALLRGVEVGPDDVDDPVMRDVLAEEGCPARLACIGEIRRAWGPTPADDEVRSRLAAGLDGRMPKDAVEMAAQCWDCLCVSDARPVIDAALVRRARQRLRRLDAELHALHMGAGT